MKWWWEDDIIGEEPNLSSLGSNEPNEIKLEKTIFQKITTQTKNNRLRIKAQCILFMFHEYWCCFVLLIFLVSQAMLKGTWDTFSDTQPIGPVILYQEPVVLWGSADTIYCLGVFKIIPSNNHSGMQSQTLTHTKACVPNP